MNQKNWFIIMTAILTTLLLSSALTAYRPPVKPAEAQAGPGMDWPHILGPDIHGTNFSPQTQITRDNIEFLQLDWVYAFPDTPDREDMGGYSVGPGATTSGLIKDGVYYMQTNYGHVIALSMDDGKEVWHYIGDHDCERDQARGLPVQTSCSGVNGRHGIEMYGDEIMISTPVCSITFLDALLGEVTRKLEDTCDFPIPGYVHPNIPDDQGRIRGTKGDITAVCQASQPNCVGVEGSWGYKGGQSYPCTPYEAKRILICPAGPVSDSNSGGRGYFAGYNADTLELLWRFYLSPPDGGQKDWFAQHADRGWVQGFPASDILAQCPSCVEWDWGNALESSAGPGWGMYAIDPDTDLIYVGTAQPGPDFNSTWRPGPTIFGDSIMALNAVTGEMVWWFQIMVKDNWDWDCAWGVPLAVKDGRKVITKGCKDGVTWGLDAATGEPLWHHDPSFDESYGRASTNPAYSLNGERLQEAGLSYRDIHESGSNLRSLSGNTAETRYIDKCGWCYHYNPFSERDMVRPWYTISDECAGPFTSANNGPPNYRIPSGENIWGHGCGLDRSYQNCASSGCIEADHAVAYGNVYVGYYNFRVCESITPVPVGFRGGGRSQHNDNCPRGANTTIVALDILTGEEKWAFFIDDVGYRGGMVASGDMLFSGHRDGVLRVNDAHTGELIYERPLGVGISTPPVIGADALGKIKIVQQIGGRSTIRTPTNVPGAVMAFSLPDELPISQEELQAAEVRADAAEMRAQQAEAAAVEAEGSINPISYVIIGVGVVLVVVAGILFSRKRST